MNHYCDENNIHEANNQQCVEMEKHKWLESEKAGYDLGVAAYFDWIVRYAKAWRDHWECFCKENHKEPENVGDDNILHKGEHK